MEHDFDKVAKNYNVELKDALGSFSGDDLTIFASYKIDILKRILKKTPKTILEFGCGVGRNISYLNSAFPDAQIYGCDNSQKSIEMASNISPSAIYNHIDTAEMLKEVYQNKVDCVFIANTLHHIPSAEHLEWMKAIRHIARYDLIIFELNPYNPITKHIFVNAPMDKNAQMLKPAYQIRLLKDAGFEQVKLSYTLFFLWRNRFVTFLERGLAWLPLGAQYYTHASVK